MKQWIIIGLILFTLSGCAKGNGAFFLSTAPASFISQLGAVTLTGSRASGVDYCFSVRLDASGNIYGSGITSGNLGETNGGQRDVYVVKFDSSGVKQWISQLGGITMTGGEAAGLESEAFMTLDSAGNIYVTGDTMGNLGETNGGNYDAFVIKLNSSGVKQWVSQLGSVTLSGGESSGLDASTNIKVTDSGDVIIAGYTGGSLGETNGGSGDIFVAKFNSSGVKQWISQLGATTMSGGEAAGNEIIYGDSMELDSQGNIYLTGATFGSLGETNGGNYDVFVAKMNSSGVLQWISQLGNVTMSGGEAAGSEFGYSLALDQSGNIYVAGTTDGALAETNGGSNDVFVAKFNSSGVKQWISQLGSVTLSGGEAAGNDLVNGLEVDESGNLFITGPTYGSLGETNGGGAHRDPYIAKFNSSGVKQWIKQLGSVTLTNGETSGGEVSNSIVLDSSGSIYISGMTTSDMAETNGGSWDVFIAKFKPDGSITP